MELLVLIGLLFLCTNTTEEAEIQPVEVVEEVTEKVEVPLSEKAVNVTEVMGLAEAFKALKELPKN